jgi:hypothetical protein
MDSIEGFITYIGGGGGVAFNSIEWIPPINAPDDSKVFHEFTFQFH